MLFPLQTYLYCFLLFFVSISIAEYSQNFKNNITVGERFTNLIDYPRKPLDCDVGKIKQLDITKEQIEAQGWKVTANRVTYDFATVTEIDDWLRVDVKIDDDNFYTYYINYEYGEVMLGNLFRRRADPTMYRWSQVLVSLWKHYAAEYGNNVKINTLQSLYGYRIDNSQTKALIQEVNVANGNKLDGLNSQIPLDPLSDEGKAMIGSPNGRGRAYLLFEHKDDFAHIVIKKIILRRYISVLGWEFQFGKGPFSRMKRRRKVDDEVLAETERPLRRLRS